MTSNSNIFGIYNGMPNRNMLHFVCKTKNKSSENKAVIPNNTIQNL